MSLVLNVEILGEFKKLTQATQGAGKDLTTLSSSATKISKGMNKAFAAIGIGLSFRVLTQELEEATKAAIEDRKSMELLSLAMINTGKATDIEVKAAEKSIATMQIQSGIADDKLRPAYQKLFIATKDVTRSNELLQIALDASASTGKDLDTVTQAMAKSLAGNDAALAKLIPSLKGSKNPIDEMAMAFKGASTEAANLDPYQRMQVIFGEIQEKLGTALLPVLDDFANWMATPKGQETLQAVADAASDVLSELTKTARWAVDNKDWLLPLLAGVGVFKATVAGIGTITAAINGVTAAIGVMQTAAGASLLAGLGIVGAGAAGSAVGGYLQGKALAEQSRIYGEGGTKADPFAGLGKIGSNGRITPTPTPNVTINVNNPNATAPDIIKKLDDYYRATGTRLSPTQ
jgi:hypothetical protein